MAVTLRGQPVPIADLRRYVFNRDGGCVFRFQRDHVCRGPLELAHVPERGKNAFGKKAPTDERHTVCECRGINGAPSRADREYERAYLASKEPGE